MAERGAPLTGVSVESVALADAGLLLVTVRGRAAGDVPGPAQLVVESPEQPEPRRVPATDVREGEGGPGREWSATFSVPTGWHVPSTTLSLDLAGHVVVLPPPEARPATATGGAGEGEALSRALAEADRRLADVQARLSQARGGRPGGGDVPAAGGEKATPDPPGRPSGRSEDAERFVQELNEQLGRRQSGVQENIEARLRQGRETWGEGLEEALGGIRELELEVERRRHEADEFRGHVAELQRQAAERDASMAQSQSALESQLRLLEKAVGEERERASAEAAVRARLEAERERFGAQLTQVRAEVTGHAAQLDARVKGLEAQLSERDQEIDRLRSREQQRSSELADAERARAAARAEIERARADLERERLERARAEVDFQRRLTEAEAESQRQLARLHREGDPELLKARVEAAERAKDEAEAHARAQAEARLEAEARLAERSDEAEEARDRVKRETQKLTLQLESERRELSDIAAQTKGEREASAAEIAALRMQVEQRERELADQVRQRSEVESRVGQVAGELQGQLDQVRAQIAEREGQAQAIQARLEEERARHANLEDQLRAELQSVLGRLQTTEDHARQQDRDSQEAISDLAARVGHKTGELREHLHVVTARLESEIERERNARRVAEQERDEQLRRAAAERATARRSIERARRLEQELGASRRAGPAPDQPPAAADEAHTPEQETRRAPGDAEDPLEEGLSPPGETSGPHGEPQDHDDGPPTSAKSAEAHVQRGDSGWLRGALRKMARHDPAAAGELLVQLLPALALIAEQDVDYDLHVAELGRFGVTVEEGQARVARLRAPRGEDNVDFELETTAAGLADMVAGGRSPRLRRSVRVQGRKRRGLPLPALDRHSIGLADVARVGLRLNPALVYQALSWAIDPGWTRGHRFCVAHFVTGEPGDTCYVTAADGERLSVALAPPSQVTASIRTPEEDFLPFLSGLPAALELGGDEDHVRHLRTWIARVQGLPYAS